MILQRVLQVAYAIHFARSLKVLTFIAPFHEEDLYSKRVYYEVLRQRTEYAFAMQWPIYNLEFDLDHYDTSPDTRYVIAVAPSRNKKITVEASMRLTHVLRLEESLSFYMWDRAHERKSFDAQLVLHAADLKTLHQYTRQGTVWDLTRLTTHTSLQGKKSWRARTRTMVAMLTILGTGVAHTGKHAVWIFTCNVQVKHFIDRLSIKHKVLAHGKISVTDADESFLCYSEINDSFENLYMQDPFIFRLINWGHYRGLAK